MNADDIEEGGGATQRQALRAIALGALALTRQGDVPCPPPEAIAAWHEQRLDAARAHAIADHVGTCDRCFALWRELVAVMAADRRRAGAPGAGLFRRVRAALLRAPRAATGFAALAAGVAAALLVALFVQLQPGARGPALPDYELSLQGSALLRGAVPAAPGAPVSFAPGTHFELVLRPAHAVAEQVAARAWVRQADRVQALDASAQQAARGVIVLGGIVGREWQLPPGDAELYVVVGHADALPDLAGVQHALRGDAQVATPDWAAWRVSVHTEAPPP